MKLAVLSESPADEEAIRILTDGLLGYNAERATPYRARGWPSVSQVLPGVIKELHYRSDADALVVVVDGNGSTVHTSSHYGPSDNDSSCRLCLLQSAARTTASSLRAIPEKVPLRMAIGVAFPAMEAWYSCGRDPRVTEAALLMESIKP